MDIDYAIGYRKKQLGEIMHKKAILNRQAEKIVKEIEMLETEGRLV